MTDQSPPIFPPPATPEPREGLEAAPPPAPVRQSVPEAPRINLPSADQSLHPAVQWYWRLPLIVMGGLATLAIVIVAAATGQTILWLVAALVAGLATVIVVVVPSRQYARWTWRLTAQACEAEHGIVWHQVRVLPYFRIQHIDIEHGPIDRMFGTASLRIHTASVTTTLPGLADATAATLRTQLLELADVETATARGDARDAV